MKLRFLSLETRKSRLALALLLGVLANYAFAPWDMPWVLPVALGGLFWLLETKTGRRKGTAFLYAYVFGFGHFFIGTAWVGRAFLAVTDALMPMALATPFLFGFVLAFFPAAAAALAQRGRTPVGRWLIFSSLWMLMEWARSWMFTGFPWNLMGSALAFSDAAVQPAAVIGTYGLSFFTVLLATSFALLPNWKPLAFAAAVFAAGTGYGAWRLSAHPTEFHRDILLRLVQPSTDQLEKHDPKKRDEHLEKLITLSRQGDPSKVSHVIWPETAHPFYLTTDEAARVHTMRALLADGTLLTGALRWETGNDPPTLHNSIVAMDDFGEIFLTYDKSHLVPFGEYVPFKEYLPFQKVTAGMKDFSPGSGPKTFRLYRAPHVGRLICYEVVFPGEVVDPELRPGWFLNVVNDAWYGRTAGPSQHFVAAKMRAVEEGIPLVRSANNGISGVFDGYGRVTDKMDLDEVGYLDVKLPMREVHPLPYGRWGNRIPLTLALVFLFIGILLRRPGRGDQLEPARLE